MAKKSRAITTCAQSASAVTTRFADVERVANRIHQEQQGASLMRALLDKSGKLHAVLSDGKATLEVMDGAVALSVAQD